VSTATPGLGLTLLGEFQARIGCGPLLAIGPRKNRALLAYLAVAGPRAHPRDSLCTLLWGEVPEDQARQSLRKALCDLRQALAGATPPPLLADSETVTLVPETVDALEFQALVRDGRPEALRGAMALYRGDLLDSLRVDEPAFEEWLTLQRERLRRVSVETLERLMTLETAGGRVGEAVEAARRLLALDPAHEVAHRSLIRLYARQGRRDAARRQYRACADVLWRDLGAKPEPETERAYREVLAGSTARHHAPGASAGRPRVLVAEDEVVTRTRLEELLAGAGYEVVVAADGADALFELSQGAIDLVLADIGMPFLDGTKLLEVVRGKRAGTPVVLLTGRSSAKLEARCLAMGAADYVTKPFDGPTLLVRLRKALRQSREAGVP
jgi:DNA-binding SARP family transcriptional activator